MVSGCMETVTYPPKYAVCLSNEITPPTNEHQRRYATHEDTLS